MSKRALPNRFSCPRLDWQDSASGFEPLGGYDRLKPRIQIGRYLPIRRMFLAAREMRVSGFVSLTSLLAALGLGLIVAFADASAAGARVDNRVSVAADVNSHRIDLSASSAITWHLYLPLVVKPSCAIPGESYGTVAPLSPVTNPPAENDPDRNLVWRGYTRTTAYLGLVDYPGPFDPWAPQLPGLFGDNRTATFSTAYRVYDWDWHCNCRGQLISDWDVTLAGLAVTPGEIIRVPGSGYDIGRLPNGYKVMVLYATANRITLKYTREDDVVFGYTLYLENICVEPNLLALYQSWNAAGRTRLPALFAGQGVGRAMSSELGVAIRDTGM